MRARCHSSRLRFRLGLRGFVGQLLQQVTADDLGERLRVARAYGLRSGFTSVRLKGGVGTVLGLLEEVISVYM